MPFSTYYCRKRRRRTRQQQQQPWCLCWRNPFCVFLVSFLAIGSLRFRERKQRNIHARPPLLRNHNIIKKNKNKNQEGGAMTTAAAAAAWEYEKMQEGTTAIGNRKFIKYRVVDKTSRQAISVHQWATILAGSSTSHSYDDNVVVVDSSKKNAKNKKASAAAATAASAAATLQFNQLLASAPYQAFYWETPPIIPRNNDDDDTTATTTTAMMEFVLVDAPDLYAFARNKPDTNAFAEHFRNNNNNSPTFSSTAVAVFDNLGKDAKLVAPKPIKGTSLKTYSDLAAFCRGATLPQIEMVWRTVAEQYLQQMQTSTSTTKTTTTEKKPVVWLSTSGGGVAWLHFRFDRRPKYYTYKPYTTVPATTSTTAAAAAATADNKNVIRPITVSRRRRGS